MDNRTRNVFIGLILIILLVALVYVFKNKSKQELPNQQTTRVPRVNEAHSPAPTNNSPNTISNSGFSVTVPEDWKGGFSSTTNRSYFLSYTVNNIDDIRDQIQKPLLKAGDIKGYEQSVESDLCKESDACGQMTQSKEISNSGTIGLEFIVSYPGLSLDEKRGSTEEIHQTFIKGSKIYRFWTSEKNPPPELLSQYPALNPTPNDLFKQIMQTLVLK